MSKPAANAPAKTSGFNAKDYVRVGVNEDEINDIKLAFDLFDTDGGQSIDPRGTHVHYFRTEELDGFAGY
jgi:hypothetical protein